MENNSDDVFASSAENLKRAWVSPRGMTNQVFVGSKFEKVSYLAVYPVVFWSG